MAIRSAEFYEGVRACEAMAEADRRWAAEIDAGKNPDEPPDIVCPYPKGSSQWYDWTDGYFRRFGVADIDGEWEN